MIIFLIILALNVVTLFWKKNEEKFADPAEFYALCVRAVFFIFLLTCLCFRASTSSGIKEFQSTKLTIETQRISTKTEYERVRLTEEIIECNQWLASTQYWAKSRWTNWFVNSDVLLLTPIE